MKEKILRDAKIWKIFVVSSLIGIIGGILDTIFDLTLARVPQMVLDHQELTTTLVFLGILLVVNGIDGTFSKASHKWLYWRVANREYSRLLEKEYSSNINYIMNTHTGALNATINEYSNYTAEMVVLMKRALYFLPNIVMFFYKTYQICGLGSVLINIIVLLTTGLLCNIGCKKFASKERIKVNADLRRITQDNMQNIKTLRYLGKKEFAMKRQKEAQDAAIVHSLQIGRSFVISELPVGVLFPIIMNLFIIGNNGGASITDIIYIIASSGTLFGAINIITEFIDTLTNRSDCKQSLKELNTVAPEEEFVGLENGLTLTNVKFGYKESDIEITIPHIHLNKGERMVVTGESGQGKSSLANLLVGVIKPYEGKVPHHKTFYIHQETECLDDSIRNNLCFDEDVPEEELYDLLDRIGLKDWVIALPDKLDSNIGERGTKVSTGQKQRINILRAVLRMRNIDEDCLVIIDEPTSNLDDKTEAMAVKLIDEYCKNTMIVVTHRPAIKDICDKEVRIENHTFTEV